MYKDLVHLKIYSKILNIIKFSDYLQPIIVNICSTLYYEMEYYTALLHYCLTSQLTAFNCSQFFPFLS